MANRLFYDVTLRIFEIIAKILNDLLTTYFEYAIL